jgi:hypothetical protein
MQLVRGHLFPVRLTLTERIREQSDELLTAQGTGTSPFQTVHVRVTATCLAAAGTLS